MNNKQMAKILGGEHSVKLTGAAILYITKLLSDKQLAIETAIDLAKEMDMDKHMLDDLSRSSDACAAMGCLFFSFIERTFGRDWLEDFIQGKVDIPEPTAPEGATIN